MTRNGFFLLISVLVLFGCEERPGTSEEHTVLQLNWFHDPTFAGEYMWARDASYDVSIRIGGPNVFPINEVKSGRADIAVVGADIFLQALDADYRQNGNSDLLAIFVDFQRNPVGWVMHPEAVRRLGLSDEERNFMSERELNAWLFEKVRNGEVLIGDKRGTETTAIWNAWRAARGIQFPIEVSPVGFDAGIVLRAPLLAYPIYLNEEPYRLAEQIGEDLVVFDPYADGVNAYGNVIVCSRDLLEAGRVEIVQDELQAAWQLVIRSPSEAIAVVQEYYEGVPEDTLERQIDRTVSFVVYDSAIPGEMTIEKWQATLNQLQASNVVSNQIDIGIISDHVIIPDQ